MTVSQSSTTGQLPLLTAPLELSFDYTRSVGPTLSKFFTAL
ncbi:MAG: DNA-binding protein, partial [Mycobacterium sp.]